MTTMAEHYRQWALNLVQLGRECLCTRARSGQELTEEEHRFIGEANTVLIEAGQLVVNPLDIALCDKMIAQIKDGTWDGEQLTVDKL